MIKYFQNKYAMSEKGAKDLFRFNCLDCRNGYQLYGSCHPQFYILG